MRRSLEGEGYHVVVSHDGEEALRQVESRQNLLELVWGYDFPGDDRTVDVHIRRLPAKVEADPAHPRWILTRWGIGYFAAEPTDNQEAIRSP